MLYAVNGCANKLCGIVNGIDVKAFDPATDKSLFMNYSVDDLEGKRVCKRELQKMLSLPVRDDVPVIGMITRLVSHKGVSSEITFAIFFTFLSRITNPGSSHGSNPDNFQASPVSSHACQQDKFKFLSFLPIPAIRINSKSACFFLWLQSG